jgi:hypothetical protein
MAENPTFPEAIDSFTVEQKNDGDTIFVQHIKELAEGIQRAEERIGTGAPEAPTHEQRITAAENNISAETTRASTAEGDIAGDLSAEVTRAQGAESALDTAKANDNSVVHLTGNETIAGTKTFSASPVVPAPTSSTHAVPKA